MGKNRLEACSQRTGLRTLSLLSILVLCGTALGAKKGAAPVKESPVWYTVADQSLALSLSVPMQTKARSAGHDGKITIQRDHDQRAVYVGIKNYQPQDDSYQPSPGEFFLDIVRANFADGDLDEFKKGCAEPPRALKGVLKGLACPFNRNSQEDESTITHTAIVFSGPYTFTFNLDAGDLDAPAVNAIFDSIKIDHEKKGLKK